MTQWALNVFTIQNNPASYFLNAFHGTQFWQLSTTLSGVGSSNNEELLNVDAQGNPVSLSTGWDGSTLGTSLNALAFCNNSYDSPYYPGGANSWTLQFSGRGTFTFFRDVTSPASTSATGTQLSVTASANGIGVALSATGLSSAAAFSGTTVTMTGSNFTTDTPVTFLNSGGSLPSPLTSMNADGTATVYYVLAGATANTFSIATTKGGSAITFSGGSGTHTGFGDWARDISLVQTKYVSRYNAGEIWNPDYTALFAGVKGVRFMQMMHTYQNFMTSAAVTFTAGTPGTVKWTAHGFRPGQSVTFQPADGTSVLPAAINVNTAYFVLKSGYSANSFQIGTTQGGSPLSFATAGTGTFTGFGNVVLASSDLPPDKFLFAGGPSYNGKGGFCMGGPSLEDMVDLCYRLGGASGCAMFINFPGLCDVSAVPTSMAQRIYTKRSALGCSFPVYTEFGNEIWSNAGALTTGFSARGVALYTSETFNSNDSKYQYGVYAAVKCQDAFRTAWTGAGGIASDHVRVFGGQNGNPAYAFDGTQGMLFRTATANGGNSSYYTGIAGSHFDAVCTAPYMNGGEELPEAWTADADGGIAKAYQEYSSGGLLFTASSASQGTTTGTASAFAVTVAGATAVNQQVINITFHTPANIGATLSLNGGPAVTLTERNGGSLQFNGEIGSGTTSLVYTDHTSAGSVSPTWRMQPYSYAGGMMQASITWTQSDKTGITNFNTTYGLSLRLIAYEGGQTFSDFGKGGSNNSVYANYAYAFNRSNQMGQLYTSWLPQIETAGQNDIFFHFQDVGGVPNTQGNYFGLLENTYQSPVNPKYTSYMAKVNGGTATSHHGGKRLGKF